MSVLIETRLRLIKSKDKDKILLFVNTLSYRIEIKDIAFCPIDKKWCLWFIPDETIETTELYSIDLD